MRSTKHAILMSGLLAAAIVAALAWYVSSKGGPVSVPAQPTETPETETPTVDTGRLMAPEEPGMSLYLNALNDLVLKYPTEITPLHTAAEMEGLGYIPVCDPLHAIVCFPYDPPEYEGTNFGSAAFSIHLRDDLGTEAECLAPQPAEDATGAVMLGETVFTSFSFGDAAMSHRLDGRNYRAWREGNCYELATSVYTSVYEVWEPGTVREFTMSDDAKVRAELEKMLRSFRFQADLELM